LALALAEGVALVAVAERLDDAPAEVAREVVAGAVALLMMEEAADEAEATMELVASATLEETEATLEVTAEADEADAEDTEVTAPV